MYTEEIKRRKSNAFFEMKTMNVSSEKEKVIEKLGSSMYASMDRLKSLKAEIMICSALGALKAKINEYQREHSSFMEKQKSLMEIQESSEKIDRLKIKIKQFLQSFSSDEIERKLSSVKEDHIREGHRDLAMDKQQQIQKPKYEGQSYNRILLEEEERELQEIEKLMAVVKQIAYDTSKLILGIGASLEIAAESMKQARLRMQEGRKELKDTDMYDRDASKLKLFFCALMTIILIVIFLLFKAASKN